MRTNAPNFLDSHDGILRLAIWGAISMAVITGFNHAASADIMSTCPGEIARHCGDVPKGKGRIAACLFAHSEKLDGVCADDVAALASSRSIERIIPRGVTELKGTPYEAELRKACTADARTVCPGVSIADERILACLYARERQLSKACRSSGQTVLKKIK